MKQTGMTGVSDRTAGAGLGLSVFMLVSALFALLQFAPDYAVQTSRLRQLDSMLLPVLAAAAAVIVLAAILVAFLKKTNGSYFPFGLVLLGLVFLLYGVITPDKVRAVLYAPFLQTFVDNSGLHIDVTTIQSVKMITDALNLVVCAACVVLTAAALLSVVRRCAVQKPAHLAKTVTAGAFLGALFGTVGCYLLSGAAGYSTLFVVLGFLSVVLGIAAFLLCRVRPRGVPSAG